MEGGKPPQIRNALLGKLKQEASIQERMRILQGPTATLADSGTTAMSNLQVAEGTIRKRSRIPPLRRIGSTVSFPISKHESIKLNYSVGTFVRFGGNYQSVSVAWQYS
jgi:hypothetical protein